jgi:hypothetical protein
MPEFVVMIDYDEAKQHKKLILLGKAFLLMLFEKLQLLSKLIDPAVCQLGPVYVY